MFQLGFADALQADREREIAELIRQRRLLDPDVDGQETDEEADRRAEPRPQRARSQGRSRAQAARG
jgi:hypothetical protein